MIKLFYLTFILLSSMAIQAQEKIRLYPSSDKVTIDGFDKEPPYIEYFHAISGSSNGAGILICPGGGYSNLADQHEGRDVAMFYNQHGFDAFVLHYRINDYQQKGHRSPDQYNDVSTAMQLIKSKAKEWKLSADKIGILGFSAGGHLASMGGTIFKEAKSSARPEEQVSSRPAFMILIYPVISLSTFAHKGSAEMLLGKNADSKLIDSLSTQNRITPETPPTFIVFSTDDDVVPVENGLMFYNALRKQGIKSTIHIFDHGGHGYGMAPKDPVLNAWPDLSVTWLKRMGYN